MERIEPDLLERSSSYDSYTDSYSSEIDQLGNTGRSAKVKPNVYASEPHTDQLEMASKHLTLSPSFGGNYAPPPTPPTPHTIQHQPSQVSLDPTLAAILLNQHLQKTRSPPPAPKGIARIVLILLLVITVPVCILGYIMLFFGTVPSLAGTLNIKNIVVLTDNVETPIEAGDISSVRVTISQSLTAATLAADELEGTALSVGSAITDELVVEGTITTLGGLTATHGTSDSVTDSLTTGSLTVTDLTAESMDLTSLEVEGEFAPSPITSGDASDMVIKHSTMTVNAPSGSVTIAPSSDLELGSTAIPVPVTFHSVVQFQGTVSVDKMSSASTSFIGDSSIAVDTDATSVTFAPASGGTMEFTAATIAISAQEEALDLGTRASLTNADVYGTTKIGGIDVTLTSEGEYSIKPEDVASVETEGETFTLSAPALVLAGGDTSSESGASVVIDTNVTITGDTVELAPDSAGVTVTSPSPSIPLTAEVTDSLHIQGDLFVNPISASDSATIMLNPDPSTCNGATCDPVSFSPTGDLTMTTTGTFSNPADSTNAEGSIAFQASGGMALVADTISITNTGGDVVMKAGYTDSSPAGVTVSGDLTIDSALNFQLGSASANTETLEVGGDFTIVSDSQPIARDSLYPMTITRVVCDESIMSTDPCLLKISSGADTTLEGGARADNAPPCDSCMAGDVIIEGSTTWTTGASGTVTFGPTNATFVDSEIEAATASFEGGDVAADFIEAGDVVASDAVTVGEYLITSAVTFEDTHLLPGPVADADGNTLSITAEDTLTVRAGTTTDAAGSTGSLTFQADSGSVLIGGDGDISIPGNAIVSTPAVNINGDLVLSGDSLRLVPNASAGRVSVKPSGDLTITSGSADVLIASGFSSTAAGNIDIDLQDITSWAIPAGTDTIRLGFSTSRIQVGDSSTDTTVEELVTDTLTVTGSSIYFGADPTADEHPLPTATTLTVEAQSGLLYGGDLVFYSGRSSSAGGSIYGDITLEANSVSVYGDLDVDRLRTTLIDCTAGSLLLDQASSLAVDATYLLLEATGDLEAEDIDVTTMRIQSTSLGDAEDPSLSLCPGGESMIMAQADFEIKSIPSTKDLQINGDVNFGSVARQTAFSTEDFAIEGDLSLSKDISVSNSFSIPQAKTITIGTDDSIGHISNSSESSLTIHTDGELLIDCDDGLSIVGSAKVSNLQVGSMTDDMFKADDGPELSLTSSGAKLTLGVAYNNNGATFTIQAQNSTRPWAGDVIIQGGSQAVGGATAASLVVGGPSITAGKETGGSVELSAGIASGQRGYVIAEASAAISLIGESIVFGETSDVTYLEKSMEVSTALRHSSGLSLTTADASSSGQDTGIYFAPGDQRPDGPVIGGGSIRIETPILDITSYQASDIDLGSVDQGYISSVELSTAALHMGPAQENAGYIRPVVVEDLMATRFPTGTGDATTTACRTGDVWVSMEGNEVKLCMCVELMGGAGRRVEVVSTSDLATGLAGMTQVNAPPELVVS
eukprot:gnl/Dysnectes_brevis/4768_a6569_297.p1 GENE.gnl/Dysnectes_brevis/4768_a6569_297~~gnl/Dysnectes_brevis/4768_a6569_297.p1  ORF type:complete len:1510 (-),score=688.77 gnl/Dysnectes_brevis/4768_a6569_297:46-4548(-)